MIALWVTLLIQTSVSSPIPESFKAVNYKSESRIPSPPENETEFSGFSSLSPQAHSGTSSVSAVKASRCPRRPSEENIPIETLEDFLGNPDRYLSTRRGVEDAHSSLISAIDDAVRRLLRSSRTLIGEEPILEGFKSPLVSEVLQYIYGAKDESHLRNILRLQYDQASLNIGQLLMVMLAAAVSSWVFDKQNDEVLKDPTEREEVQTEIWTARCKQQDPKPSVGGEAR